MSEFEELRLTISLVDNASVDLKQLNAAIDQLGNTVTKTVTPKLNAAAQSVDKVSKASKEQQRILKETLRDLEHTGGKVIQIGQQIGLIGRMPLAIGGLLGVIAGANAALVDFSKKMMDLKLTARLAGLSPDQFKNISRQLEQMGYSFEQAETETSNFFRTIREASRAGTAEYARIFADAKDSDATFAFVEQLSDMITAGKGEAAITAAAKRLREIFNRVRREGGSLSDATREAEYFAQTVGLTLKALDIGTLSPFGNETEWQQRIKLAEQFTAEWAKTKQIFDDFLWGIQQQLLPAFTDLNKEIALMGEGWGEGFGKHIKQDYKDFMALLTLIQKIANFFVTEQKIPGGILTWTLQARLAWIRWMLRKGFAGHLTQPDNLSVDEAQRRVLGSGGGVGGVGGGSGWQGGGEVKGSGTGTSDSVNIRASRGEYVMQTAAVMYYGRPFMDAINAMRIPRFRFGPASDSAFGRHGRFQQGGPVGGGDVAAGGGGDEKRTFRPRGGAGLFTPSLDPLRGRIPLFDPRKKAEADARKLGFPDDDDILAYPGSASVGGRFGGGALLGKIGRGEIDSWEDRIAEATGGGTRGRLEKTNNPLYGRGLPMPGELSDAENEFEQNLKQRGRFTEEHYADPNWREKPINGQEQPLRLVSDTGGGAAAGPGHARAIPFPPGGDARGGWMSSVGLDPGGGDKATFDERFSGAMFGGPGGDSRSPKQLRATGLGGGSVGAAATGALGGFLPELFGRPLHTPPAPPASKELTPAQTVFDRSSPLYPADPGKAIAVPSDMAAVEIVLPGARGMHELLTRSVPQFPQAEHKKLLEEGGHFKGSWPKLGGGEVDRSEIDRAMGAPIADQRVEGGGTVKVDITPRGSTVDAEGDGMFKGNVTTERERASVGE